MPTQIMCVKYNNGSSSHCHRAKKTYKDIKFCKEKINSFLFTDGMFILYKNLKKSINKQEELRNELSRS